MGIRRKKEALLYLHIVSGFSVSIPTLIDVIFFTLKRPLSSVYHITISPDRFFLLKQNNPPHLWQVEWMVHSFNTKDKPTIYQLKIFLTVRAVGITFPWNNAYLVS